MCSASSKLANVGDPEEAAMLVLGSLMTLSGPSKQEWVSRS
jgi:hypothetical protein